jgi:hypothetical protein
VLTKDDIERFRRMKAAERLKIGLDLTDLVWRFLLRLRATSAATSGTIECLSSMAFAGGSSGFAHELGVSKRSGSIDASMLAS